MTPRLRNKKRQSPILQPYDMEEGIDIIGDIVNADNAPEKAAKSEIIKIIGEIGRAHV